MAWDVSVTVFQKCGLLLLSFPGFSTPGSPFLIKHSLHLGCNCNLCGGKHFQKNQPRAFLLFVFWNVIWAPLFSNGAALPFGASQTKRCSHSSRDTCCASSLLINPPPLPLPHDCMPQRRWNRVVVSNRHFSLRAGAAVNHRDKPLTLQVQVESFVWFVRLAEKKVLQPSDCKEY